MDRPARHAFQYKQILGLGICALIIVTLLFFFALNIIIFTTFDDILVIGIIDSGCANKYDNVIYYKEPSGNEEERHGDSLVKFVQKYNPNATIYYFDASDENGKVDTDAILAGLEWMDDNSVSVVNVSLSSKLYREDFQKWINVRKEEMQIYASYSNLKNTYDYPAMYENVIASGSGNDIEYKQTDIKYRTRRIVFIDDIFNEYDGNSYLSLLTALKSIG